MRRNKTQLYSLWASSVGGAATPAERLGGLDIDQQRQFHPFDATHALLRARKIVEK
jgi:hypothetical protein